MDVTVMFRARALLLFAGLALAPVAVSAASHPPIVVTAATAHPPRTQESGSGIQSGTIDITFHNTAAVAAKRIIFAMYAKEKHVASATAHGTFSPGVTIHKTFPDTAAESHQQVIVTQVTFADGSVWVNGGHPTH